MTGASGRRSFGRVLARLAVASLGLALLPSTGSVASAAEDHQRTELRVASYNIRAGAGEDGVFDLGRTADEIAALDADVVGLEEVDVHWGARSQWLDTLQELGHRLHLHVAFAPIYDLDPVAPGEPRRQYGVGLLSRRPIVATENHEITRLSTQVPDAQPAPAPGFLEAVVRVKESLVHVYVTHLDYRADPRVREMQVADTHRILAQDPRGTAQVLLGDLNAEPTAPELQPLWQDLTDAWAAAAERSGDGPTYPAAAPTKRIDVVAVSAGIRPLRVSVPDDPLARAASDHRPVVATLRLPDRRKEDR